MLEAQTGYSEVSCKLEQSKGDKRLEEEAKSKQKKNFFNTGSSEFSYLDSIVSLY